MQPQFNGFPSIEIPTPGSRSVSPIVATTTQTRAVGQDLMQSFSPDQKEEFERIVLAYREVLLRVAFRLLRCESLAEDAVQETLLAAWRAFHNFERGSNCRAWLFRIMLNGIRRNRRRAVPLAELPDWQSLDTLMTGRSSFEHSVRLDTAAAVDALPETQRTIFLMAAVEGFTCKEISAMQAIPIGTVMSRLSRSRAELRNALRSQIRAEERTE